MMKLIIFTLVTLLHAQDGVVKGEYIATMEKCLTKETIEFNLQKIPPASITPMGNNSFLLKYEKDPGLVVLTRQAKKHFQVQPNFIYHAQKKKKKLTK